MQVWTSPFLRAAQSARIIADRCGVRDVESHDFIGNGDFGSFTAALAGRKSSSCLIVVGHEPFLGDWSLRISGRTLEFGKGTSAGFGLESLDPPTGRLRWAIDLKTLGRLGKHRRRH